MQAILISESDKKFHMIWVYKVGLLCGRFANKLDFNHKKRKKDHFSILSLGQWLSKQLDLTGLQQH